MNEWDVPNWRDASGYVSQPTWGIKRWRWEFLRRRSDLRDEFDARCESVYAETMERFRTDPTHFANPPSRPHERGFHIYTRLIAPRCRFLQPLPNPRIGDQPYFAIAWTDGRSTGNFFSKRPPEGFFRIDFDLEKPLDAQLKAAKELLLDHQVRHAGKNIQIRHHPEKWPSYLRVLDARASGASWAMVVEALPPSVSASVDTARSMHKQAEALCFNAWS